jgi:hypothetical protein
MVNEIDHGQDPDTTGRIAASVIEENDHPLAGPQPTKRLEIGGGDRRRQHQPTAPIARRPQPAPITSPLKTPPPEEEEPQDREFRGLIPTTTQTSGRSNLSRRLDGI